MWSVSVEPMHTTTGGWLQDLYVVSVMWSVEPMDNLDLYVVTVVWSVSIWCISVSYKASHVGEHSELFSHEEFQLL